MLFLLYGKIFEHKLCIFLHKCNTTHNPQYSLFTNVACAKSICLLFLKAFKLISNEEIW